MCGIVNGGRRGRIRVISGLTWYLLENVVTITNISQVIDSSVIAICFGLLLTGETKSDLFMTTKINDSGI